MTQFVTKANNISQVQINVSFLLALTVGSGVTRSKGNKENKDSEIVVTHRYQFKQRSENVTNI